MGVRKDFKKTLTCIIVLLLIPVVLYLFALFLPEYIPLFNDMYCMGKRPCDQADSIWQTDDGRLSIYGTNDGFSSTGIVKTEESEIKLVLFLIILEVRMFSNTNLVLTEMIILKK